MYEALSHCAKFVCFTGTKVQILTVQWHTLALRGVDYIISDRVVALPEQYTSCFTEQLALMPHTYMVAEGRIH